MASTALFSVLCSALLSGNTASSGFTAALSGDVHATGGGAQALAGNPSGTGNHPTYQDASQSVVSIGPDGIITRILTGGIVSDPQQPTLTYTNIPVVFLDPSQPLDRVAALVSSNEGKPTTIDWNDNGKGVSVGIFQANQKVGELPNLLHELSDAPGGHEQIVATLGSTVANDAANSPEKIRKLTFSKKNSLGKGLKELVKSDLFQRLQIAMLRRKVLKAAELASVYGITSTAGVAVCADLTNQWGANGAHRFLKAAQTQTSEDEKVKAVVDAVCRYSAYDSRYQSDLRKLEPNSLSYNETFPINYDNTTVPYGLAQAQD
jgi:hypothetical protein